MNAREQIDALDQKAQKIKTSCDGNTTIWRRWPGASHSAELVVLFHGGFGSWLHWIRNIPALTQHFDVLAVDIPGLGESDPPAEPITPASIGAIVAQGLEEIAPDAGLHLVAFSFGGVVAGQVALKLKSHVRSLTLVGASGMGLTRHKTMLIRRTPEMTEQQRQQANFENITRLMIAHEKNVDELAVWIHNTNDSMARLRSRNMSFGKSLAQALPQLGAAGVALNGIWGAKDVTAAPWIFHRRQLLEQNCDQARFHSIEDAGHWVAYEAADEFNQYLLEFIGAPKR